VAEAVIKICRAAIQAVGQESDQPVTPCPKETLSKMLEFNTEVQVALGEYPGTITHQLLTDPSLQALALRPLHPPSVMVPQPIPQAMLVFTDASAQGRILMVAYTPNSNKPQMQVYISDPESPQLLELTALEMVLKQFPKPINVLTDSVYCAQILPKFPSAYLKVDLTPALDRKLGSIETLLEHKKHPVFIQHIRVHTGLPGPLTAGNALADKLTQIQIPFHQAQRLHNVFHQSAKKSSNSLPFLNTCPM
jgi:hypothetical protein